MATKEQIDKLKKTHGEVYEITVTNQDQKGDPIIPEGKKEYKSIHKKIGNASLSYASRQSNGMQDPIEFNKAIVLTSFIEGDEEIKTTDAFVNAAANQLQDLIKTAEGRIKKL